MKKRNKSITVQKFGGVDNLGTVKDVSVSKGVSGMTGKESIHKDINYDLQSLEVKSDTHLEDDEGYGGAAIIRCFEFGMNLDSFRQYQPTKQELFNSHHKGIEVALWKDGMKIITEVNPRIVVNETQMKYQIFVGAAPMRGHILRETPQTLSQVAHG